MKILNEIITFTEWLIDRLGIETNGMKKRREEHELLVRTSQNLTALQERYTENSIQINNLMIAQREILADKINEKYKYGLRAFFALPLLFLPKNSPPNRTHTNI